MRVKATTKGVRDLFIDGQSYTNVAKTDFCAAWMIRTVPELSSAAKKRKIAQKEKIERDRAAAAALKAAGLATKAPKQAVVAKEEEEPVVATFKVEQRPITVSVLDANGVKHDI